MVVKNVGFSGLFSKVSSIDPSRVKYDSQKTLSEKLSEHRNDDVGIKFSYPEEMLIYYYSPEEEKQNFEIDNSLLPIDSINFSLIPDLSEEGTEFHDGLNIRIVYYPYDQRLISPYIEDILKNDGSEPYESVAKRDTLKEKAVIKESYCCYGGDTTTYHFFTKQNKYYVKLTVSFAGPDKDKFKVIAEKILDSLEFID